MVSKRQGCFQAIVESGVTQCSVLGPLLYLIYINDLENGIKSHIKYFADDTSLFTIIKDPDISALELNHDLHLISQWAYQWKTFFHFYNIQKNRTPPYLKDPIPPIRSHLFGSRSVNVINEIRCKSKSYSNSFYPDSIRCWNKIGPELRNSPNLKSFKRGILALVRPPPKRIFDIFTIRLE